MGAALHARGGGVGGAVPVDRRAVGRTFRRSDHYKALEDRGSASCGGPAVCHLGGISLHGLSRLKAFCTFIAAPLMGIRTACALLLSDEGRTRILFPMGHVGDEERHQSTADRRTSPPERGHTQVFLGWNWMWVWQVAIRDGQSGTGAQLARGLRASATTVSGSLSGWRSSRGGSCRRRLPSCPGVWLRRRLIRRRRRVLGADVPPADLTSEPRRDRCPECGTPAPENGRQHEA